jgi:Ca2+-binding RTX toxin-like protein
MHNGGAACSALAITADSREGDAAAAAAPAWEASMATINGTSGNDVRVGGAAADLIRGFAGNDRLFGRGGNDRIFGGTGNDDLFGESGNDLLVGGSEDDNDAAVEIEFRVTGPAAPGTVIGDYLGVFAGPIII